MKEFVLTTAGLAEILTQIEELSTYDMTTRIDIEPSSSIIYLAKGVETPSVFSFNDVRRISKHFFQPQCKDMAGSSQ